MILFFFLFFFPLLSFFFLLFFSFLPFFFSFPRLPTRSSSLQPLCHARPVQSVRPKVPTAVGGGCSCGGAAAGDPVPSGWGMEGNDSMMLCVLIRARASCRRVRGATSMCAPRCSAYPENVLCVIRLRACLLVPKGAGTLPLVHCEISSCS